MNFVIILLLQTLGTVIGGHVFLDRSVTLGKLQRRKKSDKEKGGSKEYNASDGYNNSKDSEKTTEKWVVDSFGFVLGRSTHSLPNLPIYDNHRQKLESNRQIFYEDYQSDSPSTNVASLDVCPPVPDIITDDACAQSSCQKDTDCLDDYRCCFTGCSFTCLPEVKPAALVDWRKEPRRSRSGIAWLISEPEGVSSSEVKFEECSTSPVESDEDPLLCPHGYFCHVTDPGNPKKGKPNSGYCVKQTGEKYSPGEQELVISSALKERKICSVDNIVLLDGAKITLKNKHCRCKRGYLSCKKRSSKEKAKKKSKRQKKGGKKEKDSGRNRSS